MSSPYPYSYREILVTANIHHTGRLRHAESDRRVRPQTLGSAAPRAPTADAPHLVCFWICSAVGFRSFKLIRSFISYHPIESWSTAFYILHVELCIKISAGSRMTRARPCSIPGPALLRKRDRGARRRRGASGHPRCFCLLCRHFCPHLPRYALCATHA